MNTSAKMFDWDQDASLLLLEEFKKQELLWNPRHKSYYNSAKKEEAWQAVSDVLGRGVQDIKRKMESLRGSYRRERNRVKRLRNSFTDYTPHWFAYESMKFLEEEYRKPTTKDNNEDSSEYGSAGESGDFLQDTETYETYINLPDAKIKTEYQEDARIEPEMVVFNECDEFVPPLPPKIKKNKQPPENRTLSDALKIAQNLNAQRDECAIYGDYVASKLRKFSDRIRVELEYKINSLIYEAEVVLVENS